MHFLSSRISGLKNLPIFIPRFLIIFDDLQGNTHQEQILEIFILLFCVILPFGVYDLFFVMGLRIGLIFLGNFWVFR